MKTLLSVSAVVGCLASVACSGSNPVGAASASGTSVSGTAGSSGVTSGTNGGSSSTGASQGTGAATNSGSGTTSSGHLTASSGGATTSGGALPSCGSNAVWSDNTCALTTCAPASVGDSCLLGDGGLGACAGSTCLGALADSKNCGGQGVVCPAGYACQDGYCQMDGGYACEVSNICATGQACVGPGCAPTSCAGAASGDVCGLDGGIGLCCGQTCVSSYYDSDNCGACGNECPSGTICLSGRCSTLCSVDNNQCYGADGWGFCCQGACLPTSGSDDPANCGYCGGACPGSDTCVAGECTGAGGACPGGTIQTYQGCVTQVCPQGASGLSCAIGARAGHCCGDVCIDFLNDSNNCGGCDLKCPASTTCIGGSCAPLPNCANDANDAECLLSNQTPGICCDGTCINPVGNANCGSCGNACPTAFNCYQPDSGYGATCGFGCNTTADCPTGTGCVPGYNACYALSCSGHVDATPCASGSGPGECCGGQCIGQNDPNNCGGCGVACPTGFTCNGNNCQQGGNDYDCTQAGAVSCPSGTACGRELCGPLSCEGRSNGDACTAGVQQEGTCCGGNCVLTEEDPSNCGGCAQACETTCVNGECLTSLPNLCDPICTAGEMCVGGSCVGPICNQSNYCVARDGAVGFCCGLGGACSDLSNDPNNCGACDLACPASISCVDGQCQGSVCGAFNQEGFCETGSQTKVCCGTNCADTASDPANCGRCGYVCPSGVCVDSACK